MVHFRDRCKGGGCYLLATVTWRSREQDSSLERMRLEGTLKCGSKETLTSREEEEAGTTAQITQALNVAVHPAGLDQETLGSQKFITRF